MNLELFNNGDENKQIHFMGEALKEANHGAQIGEVPVGCVIVRDNRIIGRGYNQREMLQDSTAHAEMIAISAACQTLGTWRLENSTMFVTLEPCAMCAGAIVLSRIQKLVFGAHDPKAGACGTLFDIVRDCRLNHVVSVTSGIREKEAQNLLREFFKNLREQDENLEE